MKQNRNDKCACGSGIKYKKCCLLIENEKVRESIGQNKLKLKLRLEQIIKNRKEFHKPINANTNITCFGEHDPVIAAISMAMMKKRRN